MADKPIIFSASMVRALLDGRKSQTRRVLKPQPENHLPGEGAKRARAFALAPYAPGDRLWVRETWARWWTPELFGGPPQRITEYRAGKRMLAPRHKGDLDLDNWNLVISEPRKPDSVPWKSPVHMPRKLSRLTLLVTDVRVQRLDEISEADAQAEGCPGWYSPQHPDHGVTDGRLPYEEFRDLWDSLNARRGFGWDANPWVCALTFTVHHHNIDVAKAKGA